MRLFKDSILFSVREKQASKYVFPSELEGCEFESKLCAFTGYRPQKLGVYSESDAFLRRNDFMTSRAGLLIAVFDGKPGGTAYTVASAMRNEKEVRIIDPESIVAV